jgi:TolA-binding protein
MNERQFLLVSVIVIFCGSVLKPVDAIPAAAQENDDDTTTTKNSLPACECQKVTRPSWYVTHNTRITKTERKCAEFEQQIDQIRKESQLFQQTMEEERKQLMETVKKLESKINTPKADEVNKRYINNK